MKNKSKILVTLILAIMLLSTACSKKGPEGVVATVDGAEISQETFDTYYGINRGYIVNNVGEEGLNETNESGKTYGQIIREQVLDSLIYNQIMVNKAKEKGIDVQEKVKEQLASEKEYLGEEEFNKLLKSLNIDEAQYTKMIEDNLLVTDFIEQTKNEYKIDEAEIKKYYDENKEKFTKVKASHILVDTEDEAKKIIERLNAGEKFEDLAKELSKDPSVAANGGDLGFFGKGRMVPEFEEFCFSAKVGDVSEPVKTDYGYHVIKVTDKMDDLESAKAEIESTLKDEKFKDEMDKAKKAAKIEKYINTAQEPESIKKLIEEEKKQKEQENKETTPENKEAAPEKTDDKGTENKENTENKETEKK